MKAENKENEGGCYGFPLIVAILALTYLADKWMENQAGVEYAKAGLHQQVIPGHGFTADKTIWVK